MGLAIWMLCVWGLLVWSVSCVGSSEYAEHPEAENPWTVIDILSNNVEYSQFLRALQLNGLIPELNEMRNITLFAPINSAFVNTDPSLLTVDDLMYHVVPQPIATTDFQGVRTVRSLNKARSPISLDFNSVPNGGLFVNTEAEILEPDMYAHYQRSYVQGIDEILSTPPSIWDLLLDNRNRFVEKNKLQFVSELLRQCSGLLDSLDIHIHNVTLLLPSDTYFYTFYTEVERRYLFYTSNPEAVQDRETLVRKLICVSDTLYAGQFPEQNVTLLDGTSVGLKSVEEGSAVELGGVYRSRLTQLGETGVIHVFDDMWLRETVQWNAAKYLLGLNCSRFVEEVRFRQLGGLLVNNEIEQTIFAHGNSDDDELRILTPDVEVQGLSSILYHFIDRRVSFPFSGLLSTKMRPKKLGHNPQQLRVETLGSTARGYHVLLNKESYVVSGVYTSGNTYIYVIDGPLDPPSGVNSEVDPAMHCSKVLRYLQDLDIIPLPSGVGWTMFLPCYNAWDELDLLLEYLQYNLTTLRLTLQSTILTGLYYGDFDGEVSTTTLGGTPVELRSVQGGNVTINSSVVNVVDEDVLFNTGVVHTIDAVVIPDHVVITIEDILIANKKTRFLELLHSRNMSYVLEPEAGYSLLVPTSHSLMFANVTEQTPNIDTLLKLHIIPNNTLLDVLAEIGSGSKDDDSTDTQTFQLPTLVEGVHLEGRRVGSSSLMIQISEGADREVRVLGRGVATTIQRNVVLVIDEFLSPNWISHSIKGSPFYVQTVILMLVGAAAGIMSISITLAICLVFAFSTRRAKHRRALLTHRPASYGTTNSDEAGPSAPRQRGEITPNPSVNSRQSSREELGVDACYSINATRAPIPAGTQQSSRSMGRHLNLPTVEDNYYA